MKKSPLLGTCALISALTLSACNGGGAGEASVASLNVGDLAPNSRPLRSWTTDVMLFAGDGTWGSEVGALQTILEQNHLTYETVNSSEVDAMRGEDLARFGLLLFPGGAGGAQAASLSSTTHAKIREAVQVRGVGYLGFCAGSFIASAPTPKAGQDVTYGLGVVDAPVQDYYYLESQGTDIAMTMATFADGSQRDLLWYGGPVTPNIAGGVVARYPNGNPMITETFSGNGFVMMVATHPSVSASVKNGLGASDSDGDDQDLSLRLIQATLQRQPLPAF